MSSAAKTKKVQVHKLGVALLIVLAAGCSTTGTRTARGNADALDSRTRLVAHGTAAEALAGRTQSAADPSQPSYESETITRSRHNLTDSTTPPPTAGQRLSTIVGSVGGIAVVAIIALGVLAPGVLAGFAVRTAMRWKAAFTETVAAIHHSNAVVESDKLKDALLNAQSPQTRQLVETAKRDA